MISMRMVKICDDSICKPLKLIFQSCLESGKFSSKWKKANVVPIHKIGDKQILKNYRSISLLPITGKIRERLLYDRMFEFFTENNLISDNQSGFEPGDSCISHEIYQSFDDNLEVRAVVLDISKAFDKVWHKDQKQPEVFCKKRCSQEFHKIHRKTPVPKETLAQVFSCEFCKSFSIFKKNILQFIQPFLNSIFNCHHPKGVKLLTRLRLGLSHLRDHKFKYSFQDLLNPICNCGTDVETTTH